MWFLCCSEPPHRGQSEQVTGTPIDYLTKIWTLITSACASASPVPPGAAVTRPSNRQGLFDAFPHLSSYAAPTTITRPALCYCCTAAGLDAAPKESNVTIKEQVPVLPADSQHAVSRGFKNYPRNPSVAPLPPPHFLI
jgi:hypothetical protein